jgi:hypothetical protein
VDRVKVKAPIAKESLESLIRMIEILEDPTANKTRYQLTLDVSKVRIKQKAEELSISFQVFNIVLRRSSRGVVLYFGDDKLQDGKIIQGRTKIEIELTQQNLDEFKQLPKRIAVATLALIEAIPIDLANVRVVEDNQTLPFQFKAFNLFIRKFETGKFALYLGDEEVDFN